MSLVSRVEKVSAWANRLERSLESDHTVAEFCRVEGVSVPSFYYWKKKLQADPTLAVCDSREKKTVVSSSGRASSGFRPVVMTPSSVVQSVCQATIIRLGSGVEIELGSDLAIVESIVKQLLVETAGSNLQEAERC